MSIEIIFYVLYGFVVGVIQGFALGMILYKKGTEINANRTR